MTFKFFTVLPIVEMGTLIYIKASVIFPNAK